MSQIETIGGKNAIIFVQNLRPSLRGTNATKQCAVTCVALHRLAVLTTTALGAERSIQFGYASTADMKEERVGRCPYSAEHEADETDCDILPITQTAVSPVDLPVRARSYECRPQGARAFSLCGAMGQPEPGSPCAPSLLK